MSPGLGDPWIGPGSGRRQGRQGALETGLSPTCPEERGQVSAGGTCVSLRALFGGDVGMEALKLRGCWEPGAI